MNNEDDLTIEYERQDGHPEEGVIVPHDRISPDTLRKMVEEFVTRGLVGDGRCRMRLGREDRAGNPTTD
jgi:hypothetical protein